MNTSYILIIVLAIIVVAGGVYVLRPDPVVAPVDTPQPLSTPIDNTMKLPAESSNSTPIAEKVTVTLKTTMGDITLDLEGAAAPNTVGNFVKLAEDNFYDGTSFHRVISDFMIQGGDPNSKDPLTRETHGTGGPGYQFADEINANVYGIDQQKLKDLVSPEQLSQIPPETHEMTLKNLYESQGYVYNDALQSLPMVRGTIAMANSGPNTNGSQFFIITATEGTPHLHGKHTAFGVVTAGMNVVDAIAAVEKDAKDNPIKPVIIQDIIVDRKTTK